MRRFKIGTVSRVCAVVSAIALAGCSAGPITPDRVERSIAPTFANLMQLQVSWIGLPAMAASDFSARASCRKLMAGSIAGSGEWTCSIAWLGTDRQPLRDTYDLFVTTEGCYTATATAESLGGPTLKTADGENVRNLLYTFEGCFDTT